MKGFFDWDLDGLAKGHKDTRVNCPNCGDYIQVSAVPQHECDDADLVKHHVKKFGEMFTRLGMKVRSHFPEDEPETKLEPLFKWKAFEDWLDTNEGQFEIEYARRTRP